MKEDSAFDIPETPNQDELFTRLLTIIMSMNGKLEMLVNDHTMERAQYEKLQKDLYGDPLTPGIIDRLRSLEASINSVKKFIWIILGAIGAAIGAYLVNAIVH